MEVLETKGRKMNKIKREEREDLHTFSDTTKMNKIKREEREDLHTFSDTTHIYLLVS